MATVRELINQAADDAGEFTGSEKQIAWAEKLSETRLDEIINILRGLQDGVKHGIFDKVAFKKALTRGLKIAKITRAGFWIDQRENSTSYLMMDEFESNIK